MPPPTANPRKEQEPVEYMLGQQLASDSVVLAGGRSDRERLSNITPEEALAFTWFNNIPPHRGGTWAKNMVSTMLNLRMSVDGWRANQLVRVVAASKGSPSVDIAKKPGLVERIRNPKWKEQAEAEGKTVVE